MAHAMTEKELTDMLRPLTIKDLRVQTRVRGLSPAGSLETLRQRLYEHMMETKDFALRNEDGSLQASAEVIAGAASADMASGKLQNNYSRPGGQNVGNFLTDRPSSKVLAPPGGRSQIVFGDADEAPKAWSAASANPITGAGGIGQMGTSNNNYSRPAGQNVGNFITDKPSSRVLAAPGGASQIILG